MKNVKQKECNKNLEKHPKIQKIMSESKNTEKMLKCKKMGKNAQKCDKD